jgi:hypothetical protein
MDVIHNPVIDNRAHSLVIGLPDKGQLKTEIRLKLRRMFKWEIKFNAS